MSKKSKRKKLKKKFKQLLKQRLAEQESKSSVEIKPSIPNKQIPVAPSSKKIDQLGASKKEPQTLTTLLNPYVRKDLIRIAIYLAIFVAILATTSIINQKTTWLANLASQIFQLLHLG